MSHHDGDDRYGAMTPTMQQNDHNRVEHNMTNHPPSGPAAVESFESLRRAAKLYAHTIVDACPDSPERTIALSGAEESLMWAVASIARAQ
jgi:hypothetical protein